VAKLQLPVVDEDEAMLDGLVQSGCHVGVEHPVAPTRRR